MGLYLLTLTFCPGIVVWTNSYGFVYFFMISQSVICLSIKDFIFDKYFCKLYILSSFFFYIKTNFDI